MRNRTILALLILAFMPVFVAAQNSVATYNLPSTGGAAGWALIGSFSAGQNGNTVMITSYIHAGYNASVSQDSTYVITFNSSNDVSTDANGFAGDGSWYSFGYNNAIAPGNIKWVANASGVSATAFSLYIYLPAYSANSQYTVSVDPGASWANIGSTGQSDPGSGSSTVMIPPVGFNIPYGNVGIGTANPANPLEVHNLSASETTGGWNALAGFFSNDAANPFGLSITFTGAASLANRVLTLQTQAQNLANGGNLSLQPAGGNVGIGTTAPGAKLEVDGNMKLTAGSGASFTFADGTVQSTAYTGVTCGGDYAESIDAIGGRTDYAPGDLLVIDPKAPGRFLKSTKPYSTLVAGIYSTKPGTVGRRETTYVKTDSTAVPMAMMGIVPTKVSAENGSIETGDLLVTSSTMGYAMKGTDRSRLTGAVVGKALASLDSGTGVVEVLVTLQ